MEQFVHQHGYLTVFISIALTGEFGLFTGVALARAGSVSITGVIIIGTAASFIANTIFFYTGKLLWTKWEFLRKRFGAGVEKTSSFVRRYGGQLMLVARFFYGARDIVPITLGIYDVNDMMFLIFNLIGAAIWAWFFTEGADLLSIHISASFQSIRVGILWSVLTSIALVAGYFLIRRAVARIKR